MKCADCGRDFSGEFCPFCAKDARPESVAGTDFPVVKAERDEKRKNVRMGKIIIIVVIVLLVVAAVVAAAVRLGGRKEKNDGLSDVHTESAGDESPENEPDTSPVTFSEDVSLFFDGITVDYADALED